MEFHLSATNILVILGAIALIILLVSVLKKVIRTVLVIIAILGLAYYVFLFSNMFKDPNQHANFSIDNIKQKYCSNIVTHSDSVKCYMIVDPIYNDIKSKYTEEELLDLERNPIEYLKVLNQAINRNKSDILKNLSKNKEQQIWDNFINDLKNRYPNQQIAQ
ncbi:MAG: hypothetical protein JXR68_11865 [Bacteroidales bacterium]|nr:hypothetical protein [Bacteroidales bacterium]